MIVNSADCGCKIATHIDNQLCSLLSTFFHLHWHLTMLCHATWVTTCSLCTKIIVLYGSTPRAYDTVSLMGRIQHTHSAIMTLSTCKSITGGVRVFSVGVKHNTMTKNNYCSSVQNAIHTPTHSMPYIVSDLAHGTPISPAITLWLDRSPQGQQHPWEPNDG